MGDESVEGFGSGGLVYDIDAVDPMAELVERGQVSRSDVRQIGEMMHAMVQLRDVEEALAAASREFMRLNQTDMRTVHFLIACRNRGVLPTASALAEHLNVSTASTTKILDRLEKKGHITREQHPTDRRAMAIRLSDSTRQAAMYSVGKSQAQRFKAAARLTSDERQTVIRFLSETTNDLRASLPTDDQPWAT